MDTRFSFFVELALLAGLEVAALAVVAGLYLGFQLLRDARSSRS